MNTDTHIDIRSFPASYSTFLHNKFAGYPSVSVRIEDGEIIDEGFIKTRICKDLPANKIRIFHGFHHECAAIKPTARVKTVFVNCFSVIKDADGVIDFHFITENPVIQELPEYYESLASRTRKYWDRVLAGEKEEVFEVDLQSYFAKGHCPILSDPEYGKKINLNIPEDVKFPRLALIDSEFLRRYVFTRDNKRPIIIRVNGKTVDAFQTPDTIEKFAIESTPDQISCDFEVCGYRTCELRAHVF